MKNGMYFSKNLIDSRYSNKLTSSMQRYVGSVNAEKRRRKRKSDEVHGAETQRRGIRNAEPRSRSPGILSRVLSLMDETGLTLLAGIRRCPCSCIINNSLSLSLSLSLSGSPIVPFFSPRRRTMIATQPLGSSRAVKTSR